MKQQYLSAIQDEIAEARHCELQNWLIGDVAFSNEWEIYRLKLIIEYHRVESMSRAEYAAWLYWNGLNPAAATKQTTQLSLGI